MDEIEFGRYRLRELIGQGGMGRFTKPMTRRSTGLSRSNCRPLNWRTTPHFGRGSAVRPIPRATSTNRTSSPFMISASTTGTCS